MESFSVIVGGFTARRLSDEAVATRALAGDTGAFGELYRRFRRPISSLCVSRLGDVERAEDATQETFVRVLRAAPQVVENAQAWLFTIAGNVCKDMLRRASNAEIPSDPAEPGADIPTPDSASELMRRETARLVFLALRRLPTRSRTALVLREFHGMSSAEIAESMGISKSAVDPLVSRARDAFGAAYAEVGAFPDRCRTNVERIYRDLGTGLEQAERAELDAHLATCPRCRAEHRRANSPRFQHSLLPFIVPGVAKLGVFGRALQTAASSPGVLRGLPIGGVVTAIALGGVLLAPSALDYQVAHKIDRAVGTLAPLPAAGARAFAPATRVPSAGAPGAASDAVRGGRSHDSRMTDHGSVLCTTTYRARAERHSVGHDSTADSGGHHAAATSTAAHDAGGTTPGTHDAGTPSGASGEPMHHSASSTTPTHK
jgi:RNA polymerase sigma-70 factor (ECF subfamily)